MEDPENHDNLLGPELATSQVQDDHHIMGKGLSIIKRKPKRKTLRNLRLTKTYL